jgi:hypothetical protein
MVRTDLLRPSATRIELDQRSREARLRLEQVERLLLVRRLPRQSLLRRLLRSLRVRIYAGEQVGRRSATTNLTRKRAREKSRRPGDTGVAGGKMRAAAPASASASTIILGPRRAKCAWTMPVQPKPARPDRWLRSAGGFCRHDTAERTQTPLTPLEVLSSEASDPTCEADIVALRVELSELTERPELSGSPALSS